MKKVFGKFYPDARKKKKRFPAISGADSSFVSSA
jgi:hypothetical protein